jgi:cytochrome o ubiquinol oxidase subunit 2
MSPGASIKYFAHMKGLLPTAPILLACLALAGCDWVVLDPGGDVAARERDLLVTSTWLMLLIIVPVMALTVWFAWHYRQGNGKAPYEPDWHHSMRLELVIWSAPLLIVICLGTLTWLGTHLLDPFRKLDRIDEKRMLTGETRELVINVVALDWKWLFIYPQHGIATVNEFVVPVDQPVMMNITSTSVMNSLYIPELAGMVYAMPRMQTRLHGVMNEIGESRGFSANYSGAGFSGMRFVARSVEPAEFDKWVEDVRANDVALTRDRYLALAKPSENEPPQRFSSVHDRLFDYILGGCVEAGRMCAHDMMAIDRRGGLGLASAGNVARSPGARRAVFGADYSHLVGQCKLPPADPLEDLYMPADRAPLLGAGLPLPGMDFETPLLAGADTEAAMNP